MSAQEIDQEILEAQLVILAATLERLADAADQQNRPIIRDNPHFPTPPSQAMSQGWLGATWVHDQAIRALNGAKVPKLRKDAEAKAKRQLAEAALAASNYGRSSEFEVLGIAVSPEKAGLWQAAASEPDDLTRAAEATDSAGVFQGLRAKAFDRQDAEGKERVRGIARAFHEAYERHAPLVGYETRPETRVPWEKLPKANQALTCAVVIALLDEGVIQ